MVGLFSWIKASQNRIRAGYFKLLAEALELNYDEKSRNVSGNFGGRQVLFYSTDGNTRYTPYRRVVEVRSASAGSLTFSLRADGITSVLDELWAGKRMEVGDDAIDRTCIWHTNNPEYLRAALVPEILDQLKELLASGAVGHRFGIELADGVVRYEEESGEFEERDVLRLQNRLPFLQDLAAIAEVDADSKS